MRKRSWRCLIKGGLSSDLLESKSSHEMCFMSLSGHYILCVLQIARKESLTHVHREKCHFNLKVCL